jgi:predicted CXXCH cytochrome family protein
MRKYKQGQRVDQLSLYRASVHGKQLTGGNLKSAQCVDCHDIHSIRAVDDPLSRAHSSHLVETCGRCHAETAAMFKKSPHAAAFASSGIAGCAACHSSHATEPAGVEMLTGKAAVCARCHEPGSAGGKAAADMARKVTAMDAAARPASARLAAHALTLLP